MTTTTTRDREERKLKKVRVTLMRTPMFLRWSGLLMLGGVSVDDDFPTAATNGRDEIYGRKLITELYNQEKMLAFIILHENLHKAFRHLLIWQSLYKIDPKLANIACDHVINLMLVAMDPEEKYIAFPMSNGERMGCYDERFKGMHTKQVFDILRKEQEEGGGGKGPPVHGQPGKNPGQSGGQPGQPDGAGGADEPRSFDHHDWEGAKSLSEKEQKKLEDDIDRVIRQGEQLAKRAGVGTGNRNYELEALTTPQVDWREVLREFISSICASKDASSWRKVNRRFLAGDDDVYLPSLIGERVGKILVGVDASGSVYCTPKLLTTFLSEVVAIANLVRPEKIDLVYWDGAVVGHEVYDEGNMATMAESTKPRGGGGTDPRCVVPFIKDNAIEPVCIIMLTDGEIGSWGTEEDWGVPILWVVANDHNRSIFAPVGKTLRIEEGR